jgi:hypothetical protein
MSCIRRCLLAGSAGLVVFVFAGAAQAKSRVARQLCVPVHATGVGQDLGNGMTEATISSHGVVLGITGTGLLRAVSGQVMLNGSENLSTGAFTETITGKLCVG